MHVRSRVQLDFGLNLALEALGMGTRHVGGYVLEWDLLFRSIGELNYGEPNKLVMFMWYYISRYGFHNVMA